MLGDIRQNCPKCGGRELIRPSDSDINFCTCNNCGIQIPKCKDCHGLGYVWKMAINDSNHGPKTTSYRHTCDRCDGKGIELETDRKKKSSKIKFKRKICKCKK